MFDIVCTQNQTTMVVLRSLETDQETVVMRFPAIRLLVLSRRRKFGAIL